METIIDSGKTFVKATALAKKYKYTTDYIGQLCRKNKVEAKLIGRAWFVAEDSLINHKADRYLGVRSDEITIHKSVFSDRGSTVVAVRREVRPVLTKTAHRSFTQDQTSRTYNLQTRGADTSSTYSADDAHLNPASFTKVFPEQVFDALKAHDNSSDGITKLKVILDEKASHELVFEELPEVTLRGDLAVTSLDDPDLFAAVEPVTQENIHFTPQSVTKPTVHVVKRYQPKTINIPTMSKDVEAETPFYTENSPDVSEASMRSKNVSPALLAVGPGKRIHFVVVPVLLGVSILASILFLGLAGAVETNGSQFNQSLTFSFASVIESVLKVAESY